MSAIISIRLPDELAQQLTMLAEATRRTKSFCAAEAVKRYVEEEAWQLQAIEDGLQDAGNGRLIDHGEVADWVASWGYPSREETPQVQVKWTAKAVSDLQALRAFIAKAKSSAAKKLVQKIITKVEKELILQPHLGRPGRKPGTESSLSPAHQTFCRIVFRASAWKSSGSCPGRCGGRRRPGYSGPQTPSALFLAN